MIGRGLFWSFVLGVWLMAIGVTLLNPQSPIEWGGLVGLIVLFLYFGKRTNQIPRGGRIPKPFELTKFITLYTFEIVCANLAMARHVLMPLAQLKTAIIKFDLDNRMDSDSEIALLSNLITLTPGTLTVSHSNDRKHLYIHVVYGDGESLDSIRDQIKNRFERPVLEVLDR